MLGRRKRGLRADEAPEREYEVRCDACEVSYPVGTRKCMYCGNRPGPQPLFTRAIHPDPLEEYGPFGDFGPAPDSDRSAPRTATNASGDGQDEEQESPRGMLIRMLGSLSWVLLFIAVTIYRSCTG